MAANQLAADSSIKKLIGVGVKFERIRRITGYLVGTLERFNNAKRAEERDRVRHGGMIPASKSAESARGKEA